VGEKPSQGPEELLRFETRRSSPKANGEREIHTLSTYRVRIASPAALVKPYPPLHSIKSVNLITYLPCSQFLRFQFPASYERKTLSTITKGLETSAVHDPIFPYWSGTCPVPTKRHPRQILANLHRVSPSRDICEHRRNCSFLVQSSLH
jgi:hypothetical protein